VLEVSEVSAAYGSIEILHNISLVVETGKITTLIGANGAGKTTTLKCVCGLLAPFRGQIRWKGKNLVGLRPDEIVRRGVCLVPEGRHVFPHMTVAENLDMGAYQRRDRQGIAQDLEWVFGLFPVLRTRRRQPAGTLSGGEQQMLAIARGLMSAPELLLMDEPSMGLAPMLVDEVFRVIQEISRAGKTILLVEQNAAMALSVAQRAYVLEVGSIVLTGSGASLLADPEVERAYLGL